MKTAFYLIIGLLSVLTLFRCEKEEEPLPPLNGICTGDVIMIPDSDIYCLTYYVDTFYVDLLDTVLLYERYKILYLDTFHINISKSSCSITFEDDKYYHLQIMVYLEHYNIHNKVALWGKYIDIKERGTFEYSYGENDYAYYVKSLTLYSENKEKYSASFSTAGSFYGTSYTYFSIPYSFAIEDSMKFCTEYEYDTLSSQFVCIKDTILDIREFETKLWFNFDCLRFTK
jgi:hypothetical protein